MAQIIGCGCSGHQKNTGVSKGNKKPGPAVALLIQETYKSDGTLNSWDLTAPIQAQILADLNEKDPSKRVFPIINIDSVEPENEGAQFETRPNGKREKTRDGIQTETYMMSKDASTQFLAILKSGECLDKSIYEIDNCGNIVGVLDGTNFRGRRVWTGSYNVEREKATFDGVQKVMVNFDWASNQEELNLWMLTSEEIGADLTNVKGMIDVIVNVSNVTTTGLTITPQFPFGTALALDPVVGLVIGDITVENLTTSTSVTITAVSPVAGTNNYTVAYTSGVTAADEIKVEVYRASTNFNVNPMLGVDSGVAV